MPPAPQSVRIPIWRLRHGDGPLPRYMTAGASGCDLAAALDAPLTFAPLERHLVPSGIAIALPEGFEAQVRPRSGLAIREGITVLNAPGTIDSDYRGEIQVALINLSGETRTINPGDRIAQLVIARVARAEWTLSEAPKEGDAAGGPFHTQRGAGGFGHTGSGGIPAAPKSRVGR